MSVRRFRTLKEAVEAILADSESENEEGEICILPPDDGDQSEIEDIDEDNLEPVEPSDVTGQLDVHTRSHSVRAGENIGALSTTKVFAAGDKRKRKQTENDDASTSFSTSKTKKQKGKSSSKPKWEKRDTFDNSLDSHMPNKFGNRHPELITKSPVELFEIIFNDHIMSNLVQQSLLYAKRDRNCPTFTTSEDEMRQFLGILLLSGYNCLPRERDYWSTSEDLGCSLAARTM